MSSRPTKSPVAAVPQPNPNAKPKPPPPPTPPPTPAVNVGKDGMPLPGRSRLRDRQAK